MPEVHLWGPRGYFKAPFYTDTPAHFVSEIGYHGCPARSSLEKMFDPEFVYPWTSGHRWNDQWLTKSVRFRPDSTATEGRNDLMIKQISAFFGSVPDSLDEFILASQICQAEALKFFVELWRQQKGPKRGIIWWNLRDGWPIVSDSIVDYYNTRKLAFHFIQRAQRNVQAICCEPVEGQHAIVIVNDTLRTVRGHLEIRKIGSSVKLLETPFAAKPNALIHVGSLPHPTQIEMWQMAWSVEEQNPYASHYLAASGPSAWLNTRSGWRRWVFRSRPDLVNLALPGELRSRPSFPRFWSFQNHHDRQTNLKSLEAKSAQSARLTESVVEASIDSRIDLHENKTTTCYIVRCCT